MSLQIPSRLLIVDDEPDLRTLYELTLLRQGYQVEAADSLLQARELLKTQRFDAVITDMRLPDGLGLELLRDLASQQRAERCVVITAHGSAENAVECLKAGAFDYLTKPVDLKQFRTVVASAIQGTQALRQPAAACEIISIHPNAVASHASSGIASRPTDAFTVLQKLVGNSAAMTAVKSRIVKVAGSMAPVLIRGESGTGKELVARAVHGCSHRAAKPFVAVNCSAIPENLLEAEFFGARKGAYTGSTQDRQGLFQAAKGGTLFLDEIGDLPLAMQSKLLRVIQERTVRAVGATQEESVDVRIVSATHKDLAAGVTDGSFRQDLYYRLNVIEILVPALRERLDDLPALCHSLLSRICRESDFEIPALSNVMMERLSLRPFPGNVRELENVLHRTVALGEEIDLPLPEPTAPASTPAPGPACVAVPDNLQHFLDQQERSILSQVLEETGFNRTAAATRLGLSLRQIRYRIARLGISVPGNDDADIGDESH